MEVERPAPLKADAMDADAPGVPPRGSDDALVAADGGDLYTRLKALQRQLEYFEIQVREWGGGGGERGGRAGAKGERARAHRAPSRLCLPPLTTTPLPPRHPHTRRSTFGRSSAP